MVIDMVNTTGEEGVVFKDLATCLDPAIEEISLLKWMSNIVRKQVAFLPYNCAIKYQDEWHVVVWNGHISSTTDKLFSWLNTLPASFLFFPGDDQTVIQVDGKNKGLYILLDGRVENEKIQEILS